LFRPIYKYIIYFNYKIMSFLNKIWSIGLLAFMLISLAPGQSKAQGQYISDQVFYDNLSPYGVWVYDPQYGDMWVPNVDGNFRPYATRGHWVLTEYGNTWVSDYPWGWATFHYGRWVFDDYYGWAWIPGYEWAPAWVSWRQTPDYYGWAPLTPNISIDISFGNNYSIPDYYWVFAPQTYINSPRIYNYYVPHTRVVNIIRSTTIINNIYSRDNRRYIAGPRIQDIERVTRSRPQIYNIREANRPGSVNVRNKTVNIYRPEVKRAPDARPARVVDGNAYKRENPNASIGRRSSGGAPAYNRENASKLANVAREANTNNGVVRVNNRGRDNDRPDNNRPDNRNEGRVRSGRPETRPNVDPRGATQPVNPVDRNNRQGDNRFNGRREPNGTPNINNRQAQPNNVERNRGNERRERPEGLNRSTPDANVQQQDAQRQQQREAQRQQREMQRQQQDAQRQLQQNNQQQDLQRQQREAQRQQQDAQRQQQREIQRQQQDAQRQAQQNAQQQEMQRQQRDAQRQRQDMQQRQAQDAQRQAEQQQRQQQRQEQRQQRQGRPVMPGQ
jgi:hypothetical protein